MRSAIVLRWLLATFDCEQYLQLFEELLSQRETVKDNRNLLRDPWVFIKNQISFISRNG